MGRGDRKSRKGKIFRGSYGVVRPRKTAVKIIIPIRWICYYGSYDKYYV